MDEIGYVYVPSGCKSGINSTWLKLMYIRIFSSCRSHALVSYDSKRSR